MQVTIPRWAQLVVIPLVVLVGVYFARSIGHALFVFLMATLLALLLNPLVEVLRRLRVPRGVGVPLVYLSFAAIVSVVLIAGVPPLVRQTQALWARAPDWSTAAERQLLALQSYLSAHRINVDLAVVLSRSGEWLQTKGLQTAGTLFTFGIGLAGAAATFLLVLIISFYMLIDGRRIRAYLRRILPGDEDVLDVYLGGLQTSFTRWVKGQLLLSTSVGLAAGLGVWILGWDAVGIWPEGAQYALLFGVWAGVTEVIPYVGPWLGAFPPVLLALFHSPTTALWVALIYWLVQLLENHILVPNIMGSTVGVHPLVVIFALLVGAELGGILGMLAVLPLLAMLKHTLDFFEIRFSTAPWIADDGVTLLSAQTPAPSAVPRSGEARDAPAMSGERGPEGEAGAPRETDEDACP